MNKKKIVIIGCGLIGFIYAKVLKQLNCEIVAIADPDIKRLKKTLKICTKKTRSYKNHLELYKNVEVNKYDIVAIAVPACDQLKIIKKFSEIKKHILCEKPFTRNYKEAKIALKFCEKNKINLAVGFKMRYENVFQKLKEIILSKKLGNIKYVSISYYQKKPYQKWAISNGIHRESFVHPLDLLMWIFGGVENSKIFLLNKQNAKGLLKLKKAEITWNLSVKSINNKNNKNLNVFRSIKIDGKEIKFSKTFDDLHLLNYKYILNSKKSNLEEAFKSIQLINELKKKYSAI